jgi:hypothetical protein
LNSNVLQCFSQGCVDSTQAPVVSRYADSSDLCALLLQDGRGNPVWLQLLQNLAEESLLPVLQAMAQQLAEQRALTAQLQQQLSDQNAAQKQVPADLQV